MTSVKYQGKQIPLIKSKSEDITRKWLSSQRNTKFGIMLPAAREFKHLSQEDKTKWNAVRKQWQKGDMLSKARALSSASGYISSQSTKNGKPLISPTQRYIVSQARNLITQGAKDATASNDKRTSEYMLDHGIRVHDAKGNLTQSARAIINSNQEGSAYIKRDKHGAITNMEDYYAVKRLIMFNKLSKNALKGIDRTRYKEIFENFVVYEDSSNFTVLDMNLGSTKYYGTARSQQQAMDMIASRLNEESRGFKIKSYTGKHGRRGYDITGFHFSKH